MDLKSFAEDGFNAKEWINNAYKISNKSDPKEVFVNNTLSTLQLYMQQLNHALEETTAQVVSGLPRLCREASSTEAGARGLRARAEALQTALGAAHQAAGHPLLALQRTDRLKSRLEYARQGLREADKWAALAGKLEAALESTEPIDLPNLTKLIEDMNECLEVLSGSSDHEDKRMQLEGLKNRLEAVLSPAVVEAFTGHHTDKCRLLWSAFSAMGRTSALVAYRLRCEAQSLRSAMPNINALGAQGTKASVARDLHALLLRHAEQQLEWSPLACPGEETMPWLLRLQASVLNGALQTDQRISADSPSSDLDGLADLLAACDHFSATMSTIVQREQGKRGTVSDDELKELGRAIYSPVREDFATLGRTLAEAMAEDIGPVPAIESGTTEAGTTLLLRTARGARALTVRLTQGKALLRGSSQQHLVYAAQWLIEELCSGWGSVSDLPSCLSLLKVVGQLQSLATSATQILESKIEEDEATVQKWAAIPAPLKDWQSLLSAEQPMPGSIVTDQVAESLAAAPEKLASKLRNTALKLVLSPIATHLDGVEDLRSWSGNEQYAVDLPDFSLSPQEYVTQVGQYLLTLPQHLEPLLDRGELSPTDDDPAYHFLNEVCDSACEMFAAKIVSIKKLDRLGIRKCTVDIAYLTSILEDLGAKSSGLKLLTDALNKKKFTTLQA